MLPPPAGKPAPVIDTMNTPPPPPPVAIPPPPPQPIPIVDPEQVKTDYLAWKNAKLALNDAKALEATLRDKIAKSMFADKLDGSGHLPEGTTKGGIETGNCRIVGKVVQDYNREILPELLAATLAEIGELPAESKDLVKTVHTLSVTAYKKLPEAQRRIADKMLVTKPAGTVKLELELFPK